MYLLPILGLETSILHVTVPFYRKPDRSFLRIFMHLGIDSKRENATRERYPIENFICENSRKSDKRIVA